MQYNGKENQLNSFQKQPIEQFNIRWLALSTTRIFSYYITKKYNSYLFVLILLSINTNLMCMQQCVQMYLSQNWNHSFVTATLLRLSQILNFHRPEYLKVRFDCPELYEQKFHKSWGITG